MDRGIKNGQSRHTGNIKHNNRDKLKKTSEKKQKF